jgi:tRNA(Arg) A34 adenosine deaminase TadA
MKPYDWIQIAIKDASQSPGGPFGAIIIKDDKLVARATNLVVPNRDPTAHAEINAIRAACQILETYNLQGCTLYSSCEPCPMCLAAILWANVSELYFAATRKDASSIGFQDGALHDLFRIKPRTKWPLPTNPQWPSWRARNEAVAMMRNWKGETY